MTSSRTWPSCRTAVVLTVIAGLVLLALAASGLLLSQPLWPTDREKRQFASELRESRRRVEHHEGVGSTALVPGGAEECTLQLLRQMSAASEAASTERRAHLCRAGVSSLDNH